MARLSSNDAESKAVLTIANLMAAAARTAPKARGVDSICTLIVDGEELETLADMMDNMAPGRPELVTNSIRKDARSVRNSLCVVLIGAIGNPKKPHFPLDCGACGFKICANLINARDKAVDTGDYFGPCCTFVSLDLGVALGSAAKVASDNNIDNRMMFTVGIAARKLGWLEGDIILGFPLSASGKSIYFDRA